MVHTSICILALQFFILYIDHNTDCRCLPNANAVSDIQLYQLCKYLLICCILPNKRLFMSIGRFLLFMGGIHVVLCFFHIALKLLTTVLCLLLVIRLILLVLWRLLLVVWRLLFVIWWLLIVVWRLLSVCI